MTPYLLKHVYLIGKVQRAFTNHISGILFISYSKRLEVLELYSLHRRRERDMALFICGKSSRDWSQISLILSVALSLIVGEELAVYVILVLVDWAPWSTIVLDGNLYACLTYCQKLFVCCLLVLLLDSSHNVTHILGTLHIYADDLVTN